MKDRLGRLLGLDQLAHLWRFFGLFQKNPVKRVEVADGAAGLTLPPQPAPSAMLPYDLRHALPQNDFLFLALVGHSVPG